MVRETSFKYDERQAYSTVYWHDPSCMPVEAVYCAIVYHLLCVTVKLTLTVTLTLNVFMIEGWPIVTFTP